MSIICLIKGHRWGESTLDQAILERWGVKTCQRCWAKSATPYEGYV